MTMMMLLVRTLSAKETEDWRWMPDNRWYHVSCVHHHQDDDGQEKKDIGKDLGPCPYRSKSSFDVEAEVVDDEGALQYYSDWSVYAQTTTTEEFTRMVSTWTVPAKPTKRGPAGMSSVYLFNGLEDGGGVHGAASFILQPVLQFGKSGCVLNPLHWNRWNIAAYVVDGNGRAHCGKVFEVNEGDSITGTMTRSASSNDGSSETWTVEMKSNVKATKTSTYTTTLQNKTVNAAYLTLEGMVIYNCASYPSNDEVVFTNVSLESTNGPVDHPKWVPKIRHHECNQDVNIDDNSIALDWNSTH